MRATISNRGAADHRTTPPFRIAACGAISPAVKRVLLITGLSVAAVGAGAWARSTHSSRTTGSQDFIGARRCKACHPAEYAHWRTTAHARSDQSLSPTERRDARCAGCHSTSVADGLVGVQCESCHGAGRHYWPETVMKDPQLARAVGLSGGGEPAVCGACHTDDAPSLRPFDLQAALERVRHRPHKERP